MWLVIAAFVRGLSVSDVQATLAEALGDQAAISKSTVSQVCKAIRAEYQAWARRRLDEIALDYLVDPHIYFGHFVIYNPEKALCRRQLSNDGGQTTPDLATCQPLQCRNVALTSENVKALATQLHKLDTHLAKADLLAPYVAHTPRGATPQPCRAA